MELRGTGVRKVVTPRAFLLQLVKNKIYREAHISAYILFVWTLNENLPTEAKTSSTLQENFVGSLCIVAIYNWK